jgi:Calpain family cysteine protease
MNFWTRIPSGHEARTTRRRPRHTKPGLETIEERTMLSATATFRLIGGDLFEKQGRRQSVVATDVVSFDYVNKRTITFVEQNGDVFEKTATGRPLLIQHSNPTPTPNPTPNPNPNPNVNPTPNSNSNPAPTPNLNPAPNPSPAPNNNPNPNSNPSPVNDWFSQNLTNSGIANLARSEFARDGGITFSDMESIFEEVVQSGTITTSELQDLTTIVNNSAQLNMPGYVADLASKVINPSSADVTFVNWAYGGWTPMPLMQKLVDQWFEGTALPDAVFAADGSPAYDPNNMWTSAGATGNTLFGSNGPAVTDVAQGNVGDCWFLASLAETAARDPKLIQNMFISNGNGTWTVRFYVNGTPDFVTVNDELPVSTLYPSFNGGYAFDAPQNGVLWAALAEKAFVLENLTGRINTAQPGLAAYSALDSNMPSVALAAITGNTSLEFNVEPGMSAELIVAALEAGDLVCIGSDSSQSNPNIVPDHCYAVVGYNPSSSMPFELFNPWGANSAGADAWEFVDGNGAFLESSFDTWGVVGATVSGPGTRLATPSADSPASGASISELAAISTDTGLAGPAQPKLATTSHTSTPKSQAQAALRRAESRPGQVLSKPTHVSHWDVALDSVAHRDLELLRA